METAAIQSHPLGKHPAFQPAPATPASARQDLPYPASSRLRNDETGHADPAVGTGHARQAGATDDWEIATTAPAEPPAASGLNFPSQHRHPSPRPPAVSRLLPPQRRKRGVGFGRSLARG